MKELLDYIEHLKNQSFEGWTQEQVDAYLSALVSVEEKAKEIKE